MSNWFDGYARTFEKWMPSPFVIAVLLTALTALLSIRTADSTELVLRSWTEGLWNAGLIRFGFQAMFMLVLGHVLALAPPVYRGLHRSVSWIVGRPKWWVVKLAAISMILGWLNWGLGLVGGAILAKGVLDFARENNWSLNRGLVGAAGYTGMLVWHGGLSGSAPLKVAEQGHLKSLVSDASWSAEMPDAIGLPETVFAPWSLALTLAVALSVLATLFWLVRSSAPDKWTADRDGTHKVPGFSADSISTVKTPVHGAERLEQGHLVPGFLGLFCFVGLAWWAQANGPWWALKFVTPDWINMLLLGLALWMHGSIRSLLTALDIAIQGASGILIQFPLYFGIMGMVTGTGLGTEMSSLLVSSTSKELLPLALFGSSGILNIFVPSGGGQWAVQGPLVLETCHALGVPWPRGIMAMAYGDQLTNLLQPFWALPLLGITGLKAREILPHTVVLMCVAGGVMMVGLWLSS